MKRDMALIRELLLRIETEDYDKKKSHFVVEGHTPEEIEYHLFLLLEAEFIRGTNAGSAGRKYNVFVSDLTMKGHDFLDTIRDPRVWNETQKRIGNTVGSVALEVLKALAESVTKGMLGLP